MWYIGASLVAQTIRICLQCRRPRFDPWVGKMPWRKEWLPTPVLMPREFHRQRNLARYSPWSYKVTATEQLTLSFFLSICIYNRILKSLSRVRLLVTVAHQASLSMGFSRHDYWSGLPFLSPGDLPNPEIKPGSPALQTRALPSDPPGKPITHT